MVFLVPSLFFFWATCVAFASVHFVKTQKEPAITNKSVTGVQCTYNFTHPTEVPVPREANLNSQATLGSVKTLKFTCGISPKGETYTETITCTEVQVTAPCEVSSKPYETYPKCCPVIKCTAPATSDTEASESGTNFQPYIWNFSGLGRK